MVTKTNNSIYFYLGIIVYSIGIISSVYAMYTFSKADLSRPVTSGIYKYSRHPMQVMYYLSWIGLGFISGTWIMIIYAIIFPILALVFDLLENIILSFLMVVANTALDYFVYLVNIVTSLKFLAILLSIALIIILVVKERRVSYER